MLFCTELLLSLQCTNNFGFKWEEGLEKWSTQALKNQPTQPIYEVESGNKHPGRICGRQVLSVCINAAPCKPIDDSANDLPKLEFVAWTILK